MDKNLHKKYIPQCPRHYAVVDQYMWPEKDTMGITCFNGISHPIYDANGWINYSLPLASYPPVNQIHPEIAMVHRNHLNSRNAAPQDLRRYGYW